MIIQERVRTSFGVLRSILPALVVVLTVSGASTALAGEGAVRYVDCDRGNDANSGLTRETAKRTVRAAIHSAPDGGGRTLIVSGSCENRLDQGTLANAVKSHRCAVDLRKDVATFRLRFQQPPDFLTVDEQGLQAFSFQYFVEAGAPPSGIGDFYAAAAGEGDPG
jgi:hypothetical protein